MHVACATKKGAIVIVAVLLFGVMNALFEFVLLSMILLFIIGTSQAGQAV